MKGKLNIDPARKIVVYPDRHVKEFHDLINKFEEEKLKPNIRLRISLVAETLMLLAKLETYESGLKMKALEVVTRDRINQKINSEKQLEQDRVRRITNG